jgi:hypothetical protein
MVAPARTHPLDKVPEDVLNDIFQRLSYGDLARFAATASASRRTVRPKLLPPWHRTGARPADPAMAVGLGSGWFPSGRLGLIMSLSLPPGRERRLGGSHPSQLPRSERAAPLACVTQLACACARSTPALVR